MKYVTASLFSGAMPSLSGNTELLAYNAMWSAKSQPRFLRNKSPMSPVLTEHELIIWKVAEASYVM
jgi:hypothetical protein